MKKVLYIVKSELHIYPPCVTQIRLLKKSGVVVEVLFGSCKDTVRNIFDEEGIPYKQLLDERGKFYGTLDKLNNYYCFRKSLKKELKQRDLNNTILWFGNAETLLSMKGALSNYTYAVTFLELLDDHPMRMRLLKEMAQKALFNVSCEETRAYIMRAWWSLKTLPYVMPNKPYDNPSNMTNVTDQNAKNLLDSIGNKKIILYQGLIKQRDILEDITKAVDELDDDYVLLLMGNDREKIIPELKRISNKVYSGWVTAPNHLQVTSKAYIGLVFYDGDYCLNNAYCAPNKIYEYGAFGIPMLANDIPGLKNTVANAGAAICTDLTKECVIDALNYITIHYDNMRIASKNFYESTDLNIIIQRIVREKLA
jgi:hypothetical protein